ncbi:MAG: hypothetical protein M5U34_25125 [Chloroflexi bacterium]|nr:hypothetical protein [Chloroflexota bacterium]
MPDIEELVLLVHGLQSALTSGMQSLLRQQRRQVESLLRTLDSLSPQARLDNNRQRVDMLAGRLERAVHRRLERAQSRLDILHGG